MEIENNVEFLTKMGFVHAGLWHTSGDKPVVKVSQHQQSADIMYTFVSDGKVLYLGKSVQKLGKRMYGYSNPGPTQFTNKKVNALVLKKLLDLETVDLYVLKPTEDYSYCGVKLNVAAGLEDTLIKALKPQWNVQGVPVVKLKYKPRYQPQLVADDLEG